MKYINKLDWNKVDTYRTTSQKIIAFTSTNEGTKENPIYNAHILNSDNTITPMGIIDIERIISMGETYNKELPQYFGISDYNNGVSWKDFMRNHKTYFMEASRVRTMIAFTLKEYRLIKIENLV
jgi:hypothetical protein